jgi:hypothetical protein
VLLEVDDDDVGVYEWGGLVLLEVVEVESVQLVEEELELGVEVEDDEEWVVVVELVDVVVVDDDVEVADVDVVCVKV